MRKHRSLLILTHSHLETHLFGARLLSLLLAEVKRRLIDRCNGVGEEARNGGSLLLASLEDALDVAEEDSVLGLAHDDSEEFLGHAGEVLI